MNRLSETKSRISNYLMQTESSGISMHFRLLGFLAVLVFILLILVLFILLLTGSFTAGLRETESFYTRELEGIATRVEKEYGAISASAVDLSNALSQNIERFLAEKEIDVLHLSKHPEVLEELLDREFDRLLFSLEKQG